MFFGERHSSSVEWHRNSAGKQPSYFAKVSHVRSGVPEPSGEGAGWSARGGRAPQIKLDASAVVAPFFLVQWGRQTIMANYATVQNLVAIRPSSNLSVFQVSFRQFRERGRVYQAGATSIAKDQRQH